MGKFATTGVMIGVLLAISTPAEAAMITSSYTLVSVFTSGPILTATQVFNITFDPTVSSTMNVLNGYSESTGSASLNAGPRYFDVNRFSNFAGISVYAALNGSGLSGGTDDFSAAFAVDFSGNVVFNSAMSYSVDAPPAVVYMSASAVTTRGAITPGVPEPASWALLIGGFGLIGGTLRTRVRKGAGAFAVA